MVGALLLKTCDLIGNTMMPLGNYRLSASGKIMAEDTSDPVMPPGKMMQSDYDLAASMKFMDNPMMLHSKSPRLQCVDPKESMDSLVYLSF
jgi:hypothetical protein